MNSATVKTLRNRRQLQSEVVIQITKKQLINFFRAILLVAVLGINFIAITTKSPFLNELITSQVIILLVCFVKFSESKTIVK